MKKLDCEVSYDKGSYVIRNEKLDITVWGNSRDEAEAAFAFSFDALYQNFALEDDTKLTSDAIALKSDLHKIVKNIFVPNEA